MDGKRMNKRIFQMLTAQGAALDAIAEALASIKAKLDAEAKPAPPKKRAAKKITD